MTVFEGMVGVSLKSADLLSVLLERKKKQNKTQFCWLEDMSHKDHQIIMAVFKQQLLRNNFLALLMNHTKQWCFSFGYNITLIYKDWEHHGFVLPIRLVWFVWRPLKRCHWRHVSHTVADVSRYECLSVVDSCSLLSSSRIISVSLHIRLPCD